MVDKGNIKILHSLFDELDKKSQMQFKIWEKIK